MSVEILENRQPWPTLSSNCFYPRLNGHEAAWLTALCNGLKHKPFLLMHRNSTDEPDGVLPLVLVRSNLFGKFLVSLPYLNTGGPWAANQAAANDLVTHACNLADELDVRYLELRTEKPIVHDRLNASRTDKVHMRLGLPATDAELELSFKSKLRSQIKKSNEHGLTIHWGRTELLHDFYHVFAINMRDLGTPVFSRLLFSEILQAFPKEAELCVVRKNKDAIAAGLLVHKRGVSEVPSASSLRSFNFTNANMWMYRRMLERAIERNSHTFDFGRSSEGSGTYKFKSQWGAQPFSANWQYYVRKGTVEEMRPDAGGKRKLVRIWQKLPVALTRIIGPSIIRGIP